MNEDKTRHTVWLTPDAWSQVENSYTKNCAAKDKYIEKAIRFYAVSYQNGWSDQWSG